MSEGKSGGGDGGVMVLVAGKLEIRNKRFYIKSCSGSVSTYYRFISSLLFGDTSSFISLFSLKFCRFCVFFSMPTY